MNKHQVRSRAWIVGAVVAAAARLAMADTEPPASPGAAEAVAKAATTTTLSASPNPVKAGKKVTLTAVVTTTGATAPTGKVKFFDGTTLLGSATVKGGSTATLSVTMTATGTRDINATYAGDASNAKSSAATLGTGDVVLLMHMDGSSADASKYQHQPVDEGGLAFDPVTKKVGSASADYSGGQTRYAASSDWAMGAQDFTAEGWVYFDLVGNTHQSLFGQSGDIGQNTTFGIYWNSDITPDMILRAFAYVSDADGANPSSVSLADTVQTPTATWTHVALVRHAGMLTLYKNGLAVDSKAISGTINPLADGHFSVGVLGDYTGFTGGNDETHLFGHLDDLRITRGAALYTAPFTPSAAPLPDPVLRVQ